MLRSIRRRAAQSVLAALIACCVPLAAQAGTINIHLTDMDVLYMGSTSGGSLFDAMGGFSGGSMVEGTADDISSADFEVDPNIVGSLDNDPSINGDDLHVDLRISNIGPTVPKNVYLPAAGNNNFNFGLDFFTDTGYFLKLRTDEVSLLISNTTFLFSGEAQFDQQNLPFGLALDPSQPIQFSFIANFPSVPIGPNGTPISQAVGSGVLTISGMSVTIPEPATAALICVGLIVLGIAITRRQRPDAWAVVQQRRN